MTIEQVVAVIHQNADNAAKVVKAAITSLPVDRTCTCVNALRMQ